MPVLFIGFSELALILLVVLLLFGAKFMPELARTLGKLHAEFNKAHAEIQREINSTSSDSQQVEQEVQKLIDEEESNQQLIHHQEKNKK